MTEQNGPPNNREVSDALARMAVYHAKQADLARKKVRWWSAVAVAGWVLFIVGVVVFS